MVHFYNHFIPAAAANMQPLYTASAGREKIVKWSPDMESAFVETNNLLACATLLVHPRVDTPMAIATDASDIAIGGILQQLVSGVWQPLAFFSRQLQVPEHRWGTFDRELLGLHLTIRHFRCFLEGRQFVVFTDHKLLVFTFHKSADPWSPRQQQHLAYISEYTTDVQHISGKENFVADALSRSVINAVHSELAIDFAAMATAQLDDADIATYKTCATGLDLHPVPFGSVQIMLLCDVSTGCPRPLVPAIFRRTILDVVHNLSHPSIRSTKASIASKFVWPGLQRQVSLWAHMCVACQHTKIQRHVRAPLQTFSVPHRQFDHIHIDLVGPFPISQGHTMLLTIVDCFMHWPEAIPISGDMSAAACA